MANASTYLLPVPIDPVVAALTNGTYWQIGPTRVITWAIADNPSFAFGNPFVISSTLADALGEIEKFVNVDFVYGGYWGDVRLSPAELTYTVLDFPLANAIFSSGALAFAVFPNEYFGAEQATYLAGSPANYPYAEGDVFLNGPVLRAYGYDTFWDGSAGKFVLIHETGHALGLKHPHDDGGTGRPTFASIGLSTDVRIEFSYGDGYDVDAFTAMSYNDDLSLNLWSGDPATLMPLDVIALQWLYGANPSTNAGDTTHYLTRDGAYRTVWDASGADTLDASFADTGWIVALQTPTDVALLQSHLQRLAVAVPILPSGDVDETTLQWTFDAENVWGSMYSDLIIGSDGPNLLGGNPGDDIVAGLGGNDVVVGNAGDDLLDGGAGDDVLAGGPGDDQLIDEEGRDIAVFAGSHASYRIVRLGDTWQVIDEGGSDGTDDLIAIERLFFADSFVAVDLDGAAGNTAKLIGAIFGEQYLIPEFVGIGISFFDAGWSMIQVAQLALNTDLYVQLAGSRSNADFVQLVYENVVGFAPSASEQAYYQGFLDRGDMTQAQLAVMAAETAENALNIDLIGLSSTGIEFIPFGG